MEHFKLLAELLEKSFLNAENISFVNSVSQTSLDMSKSCNSLILQILSLGLKVLG